ncbi:MAG: hypoxanthine phosphoribosyltransferase [Deltaproteobacteria bacterium]|nr:hypoxanthine phosphoribosyltransferase [Deltaproteobacteria bacterium]
MPFYDMSRIEILISEPDLQARIRALGERITRDYAGAGELVLVCVLKGSYLFLADLSRAIDLPLAVDFMSVSSYGHGFKTSGVVRLVQDLSESIEGKHVLVVEDIIDTGLTMGYLLENLQTRRPASLKVVSLLHKPSKARVPVQIDYLGFEIEDRFVIGYGLDFQGRFRNMPFIGVNTGAGAPLAPAAPASPAGAHP